MEPPAERGGGGSRRGSNHPPLSQVEFWGPLVPLIEVVMILQRTTTVTLPRQKNTEKAYNLTKKLYMCCTPLLTVKCAVSMVQMCLHYYPLPNQTCCGTFSQPRTCCGFEGWRPSPCTPKIQKNHPCQPRKLECEVLCHCTQRQQIHPTTDGRGPVF